MTEVLPIRANVTPEWRPTWAGVMPDAIALAERVSDTEFVPRGLRGKPPAILAAIMYGHEIGLPPMQSLARIAVIDGRPNVSAETLRGLILAAGHSIWIVDASTTRVTMAGRRRGDSQSSEVTWTADDAKRAGLSGKPNWRAYPRQMLTARATAELARIVFADVIGGMMTTEELDDGDSVVTANGDEAAADAPKQQRRRRRQPIDTAPETTAPARTSGTDTIDDRLPLPDRADPPQASDATDPPQTPDGPVHDAEVQARIDDAAQAAEAQAFADAMVERERENIAAAEAMAQTVEPTLITDPQRRKMQAMFREKGVRSRESRLAYATTVTGRQIESSSLLTIDEAAAVIDALDQWNPEDPDSKPFPPGTPIPPSGQGHPHTPLPEGY